MKEILRLREGPRPFLVISLKASRNLRGSRSPLAGWIVDKLAGRPTGRLVRDHRWLAGWMDIPTLSRIDASRQAVPCC